MSEIAACTLIQEEPDRKTERYMMMFKDYPDVVTVEHRQHFPGEHKGMICNKNKAARNLKKVRTACLVPMVGLEPTWFPERF